MKASGLAPRGFHLREIGYFLAAPPVEQVADAPLDGVDRRFGRPDLAVECRWRCAHADGSLGSEVNVIVLDSQHPPGASNPPLRAGANEPAGMSGAKGLHH